MISNEIEQLEAALDRLRELQYWIDGFLSRASQDPWTDEHSALYKKHYEAVIQAQNYTRFYKRTLTADKKK